VRFAVPVTIQNTRLGDPVSWWPGTIGVHAASTVHRKSPAVGGAIEPAFGRPRAAGIDVNDIGLVEWNPRAVALDDSTFGYAAKPRSKVHRMGGLRAAKSSAKKPPR
jgi:hypothetical protein